MNTNYLIHLSLLNTYQKIEKISFIITVFFIILYVCILIDFFKKE